MRMQHRTITLGAGRSATAWNQLTVPGTFEGHQSGGTFTIDHDVVQQIIRNFNATTNRHVVVDFEHLSETLASPDAAVSGAPAAGWCTELKERAPGELWGKITWLEPALTYIREDRYRYLSPAIVFDGVDRKTGKPCGAVLTSIGCVNAPFLDSMQPIAASARAATGAPMDHFRKMAREVLLDARSTQSGREAARTVRAYSLRDPNESETTMYPDDSLYDLAVKLMDRDKTGTMTFGRASSLASKMMRHEARAHRMGQSTDVRPHPANRDFLEDNANTQQRPHGASRLDQNTLFSAVCKRLGMDEHDHESLARALSKVLDHFEATGGRL